MKKINPEHIKAILELINRGPYFELLSIRVCDMGIGYSKVEVELDSKHLNPFGVVHGGVFSSVIDTAAYWAAYCELEENLGLTTIDVKVDNLLMAKEGLMTVEGRTIKIGRSICLTEATAKNSNGKLLAHGTSKLMVLQGLQSIKDVMQTMGCEYLPPKFID